VEDEREEEEKEDKNLIVIHSIMQLSP